MNFQTKIKELRNEKNLSQLDIAQITGFAKNTICAWEKGRAQPNFETLIKLADVFEVSIDYLLGRENDFGIVKVKNELTTGEETLLGYYRKLNEHDKHKVLGFVQALAY